MAEFKPMVKMYTDEPSVILKLKKGGKVKGNIKAKMASGQSNGFKSMASNSKKLFEGAPDGMAPKKPSISARMKAMNPNLYAKGGKVVRKQMGGMMPGAAGAAALGGMAPAGTGAAMAPVGAGADMAPMNRAALAGMAPSARMRRAAAVRRALAGMKKGGSTSAQCAKLEKELQHHEAMSMNKAHPMKKASGGAIDSAETKTTLKNSVKPFAKSKMVTSKRDTAHGTGEVKEGKPGGYAMGGSIMNNEGPFKNTKMVSAGKGKTNGTTGGVRMGNAGGFKHGGKAMKYASGGAIDSKMTRTTVEGGNWENRAANTSKPGKTNTKTGEVKQANAGGYKHGGSASKKAFATGGQVVDDGKAVKYPRHFVSRPVANSLQSGTFKRGGNVKMSDGGSTKNASLWTKINPTLKDKYMRVNEPVNPNYSETAVDKSIASSNRSGRKIGGKEAKAIHSLLKGRYADGGTVPAEVADKLKDVKNERAYKDWERRRVEENKEDRNMIPNALNSMAEGVRSLFSSSKPPEGSVTKTEKSVTVAPAKRRGGLTKC